MDGTEFCYMKKTPNKPQKSNVALPRRQVSVPSTIHQQMLNDKELFPSVISKDALECIKDAAGCFSRVNTMMLRSPESIDPDYSPENIHLVLTDAEYMLPVICNLITDYQPDSLPLVRDILSRMHTEKPNIEPQYMARALRALKNAIILLRLDDNDNVNVNTLFTKPREFIAAAMIVNQYLKNLSSYHTQLY